MNKYQEALNLVKQLNYVSESDSRNANSTKDVDDAHKILQELVDRATPIKPSGSENQIVKSYECSKCGEPLPIYDDYGSYMDNQSCVNRFCRFCGQALDWSD